MIQGILLDIGGVIANDVWESVYYDSKKGIYANNSISKDKLHLIGEKLWAKYSIINSDPDSLEIQYWLEFCELSGIQLNIDYVIEMTNKLVVEVDGICDIIKDLLHKKYKVGICSDNTKFWYKRQYNLIRILSFIDPNYQMLSCNLGKRKSDSDSNMFEQAMLNMDLHNEDILFIDDRILNIEKAVSMGIKSVLFPSHSKFGATYLKTIFKELNII